MIGEAEKLRGVLESVFRVALDKGWLQNRFSTALRRSLTSDPEELAALVLAECWEAHQNGAIIDEESVTRVLNRVQKRLERDVRRSPKELTVEPPETLANTSSESVQAQRLRDLRDSVQAFVSTLTPDDALLFHRCIMDAVPIETFVRETHIPKSTVYRHLKELRERLRQFLAKR
jgi:DNA-directed RNA polymerase specialized sigma24 family protein